ncbi:hypothetical protein MSAN_00775500 [Mycena sanguinolenta]|uniref:Uncharacterized protein n=1 Tax=Mycena sanguinolenta TaxID=230812 RepID=A0A8H6Z8Z3_9AGAR|nr:hypothetical protein MSAN_00775500 [Mycena sanguinolenta]
MVAATKIPHPSGSLLARPTLISSLAPCHPTDADHVTGDGLHRADDSPHGVQTNLFLVAPRRRRSSHPSATTKPSPRAAGGPFLDAQSRFIPSVESGKGRRAAGSERYNALRALGKARDVSVSKNRMRRYSNAAVFDEDIGIPLNNILSMDGASGKDGDRFGIVSSTKPSPSAALYVAIIRALRAFSFFPLLFPIPSPILLHLPPSPRLPLLPDSTTNVNAMDFDTPHNTRLVIDASARIVCSIPATPVHLPRWMPTSSSSRCWACGRQGSSSAASTRAESSRGYGVVDRCEWRQREWCLGHRKGQGDEGGRERGRNWGRSEGLKAIGKKARNYLYIR